MPRQASHRLLARVIESDADLAGWTARHRREAALTRLVRAHLPRPIAERVHVTDTRDGRLELATAAGAIAAAVRQRVPTLRAALARDGHDFAEIAIRVHLAGGGRSEPRVAKRQWDSSEAAPLFELADRLPDGPLKAALGRWSRRARGRAAS